MPLHPRHLGYQERVFLKGPPQQFPLATADHRISAPVALNPTGVSTSRSARLSAPEGMCVNLLRFKRRNGLSNHLKETMASENVIASAHRQESVQLCA